MNVYEIHDLRKLLADNVYPGRGIVTGLTDDGKCAAIAYFIMGRSDNSRNRVFTEKENGALMTEPFDPSKVKDPSLILYYPIRVEGNHLIVTNGDQTDTIRDFVAAGKTMEEGQRTRCFEPDPPNLTPRISSMLTFAENTFTYQMSILKSADPEGTACNRFTYEYSPIQGVGHFLHTYVCDGNPLPTFVGEPERVHIPADIDAFTQGIWENLNTDNRISLYVRFVDLATGKVANRMINRFVK